MNDTTKLVLENQIMILQYISSKIENQIVYEQVNRQIWKTKEALKPKESNTTQKIKNALDDTHKEASKN